MTGIKRRSEGLEEGPAPQKKRVVAPSVATAGDDSSRAHVPANLASLSDELLHQIITHAVDDSDKWRAKQTFTAVLGTGRRLRRVAGSKALQQYKENLVGGRLVSDAVIETAFRDGNFSNGRPGPDRLHIGHEAEALTPALEFQSPEVRSEIFNSIAAKDIARRVEGYVGIVDRRDLFKENEISRMYSDALDTFREYNLPGSLARYAAGIVLVKAYNDIGPEGRDKIQEAISKIRNLRRDFCSAIITFNPSLLRDDGIRLLVRKNFEDVYDPHEAIVVMASYIDKKSQDDTDFIISRSLDLFGKENYFLEVDFDDSAKAIAKVFDGTVRKEYKIMIENMKEEDTEAGHALTAAFKELERGRPAAASIEGGMVGSAKLLRELVRSQNMSSDDDAIGGVRDVAKASENQQKAARRALMNSVAERNDRVRTS